MSNWYANRDIVKDALGIPATSTREHMQIDSAAEAVSRLFETYTRGWFYPALQTRHYTPEDSRALWTDPLLSVVALHTAPGGTSFDTTWDSGDYRLAPYNASMETPKRAYTRLERTTTGRYSWPVGVDRSVRVQAYFGHMDERTSSPSPCATEIDATQKTMKFGSATMIHVGQTLLVDSEQVFLKEFLGTTSGEYTVERARNGTSGATHSSNSTVEVYQYPEIERAAIYQVQMDFRAKDSPMGVFVPTITEERMRAPGGIHPFVARMLDPYRRRLVA